MFIAMGITEGAWVITEGASVIIFWFSGAKTGR
jgi:hypothetical protein